MVSYGNAFEQQLLFKAVPVRIVCLVKRIRILELVRQMIRIDIYIGNISFIQRKNKIRV